MRQKNLVKMQHQRKERKKFYKYTTKFSSIQWVFISLKKFFRNSRCAVGLCNIIVNCQVKIAEVFLSSAVQCTYYLLACFYFCSSKFKFKETHSIYTYQDSKLLATLQLWYTNYGRPARKQPSLHGQKLTHTVLWYAHFLSG